MKTFLNSACVLCALLCASSSLIAAPVAVSPKGGDGRTLNLDFESGNLSDWKVDGAAFEKQPVRGDLIRQRQGPGGTSGHHGEYWIGGYETGGDDLLGTLTSVPFQVIQPWASFLVAGGNWEKTRVELVDSKTGTVFFKITGNQSEYLRPVVVDLSKRRSQEIFIRLVDEQKGGWGHVNFDDFKFYAERPSFPDEIDPKKQTVPEADKVLFAGLSPEEAAAKMTLPKGFKATLFAGEPDVKQPIAFAIDDRGRLWVAEAYTYPKRAEEGQGKDRILVFDDTNGDGKFDKRTVFMEQLNLVSGIEVGFGGVFVGAAPYLTFIPVNDWDNPKPAGKPEILLDGWDYKRDTHETLNSFQWGPDGWLYGSHGVFCPSHVGKPGAPESERQWMDAGIWRYHPTKKVFEVFAEGTSNPWGFDFDEHGQLIEEACVIPHLWHMIQGGRYQRQGGEHFAINSDETARSEKSRDQGSRKPIFPYVYDDIKTIGDHVHYAGDKGPHAGNGRSDAAGGGHAHAGLLIYQGDNFPADYRGKIFMNNIHGSRINMDTPERKGSGLVGHHGADFAHFNDTWSQVINLQTGPDGAVYMIDWYDKNQCHHNDANGHDRNNGRIFKVSYGTPKFEKVDLQKLSGEELIKLLASKNNWQARHAQRILQEWSNEGWRRSTGERLISDEQTANGIASEAVRLLNTSKDKATRLRALWTLHVVDDAFTRLEPFLNDVDEHCRAWAIQGICEQISEQEIDSWPKTLDQLKRLAREDKSPVVRLYLASALQRLPLSDRWEILEALLSHAEDANDHNLPLMYWYAAEPLVAQDTTKALGLLKKTKIPLLREFLSRRITSLSATDEKLSAKTE